MAIEYIDRPPRIQPELPIDEVQLPSPPDDASALGGGLANTLIPLITIVGFVLVSGSGNVLFIVPMGLAAIASVIVSLRNASKQRREAEQARKEYSEMLAEKRHEMARAHHAQRFFYHHNFPDVNTLYEIAAREETSRFGSRLWERRPDDQDFGAVRLGIGNRPSTVVYRLESGQGSELQSDSLYKDAEKLARDSEILSDTPVTVPLRPHIKDDDAEESDRDRDEAEKAAEKSVSARQSIGIFGPNPTNTSDFARAIVAHFVTMHSAIDTRLHVIGHPHAQESWRWAEWLPHCNERDVGIDDSKDSAQPEELDQLCFSEDKDKVADFWMRLKREFDQRQLRMQESDEEDQDKGASDESLPLNLVVVDMLGEMPEESPLAEVASENVVSMINKEGPTLGGAIIFLANDPSKIPSDCKAMIEVASVGDKVVFRYAEVGVNTPRYLGTADLALADDARRKLAAQIRRLDIRRPFGSDLPRLVNVLQMQSRLEGRRIHTVDKVGIPEKWSASLAPDNQEWLRAPIGMTSLRDVRTLVFSAKEGGDGVHGMIAGTTGSGKSELLLTLVGSMAMKYDPRLVNFVLVDFKGGAAFEPLRELPHTVDILTNLEANAVERMFIALQAVMDERSKILAESGAKDIVEYRERVIPRLKEDDPLPKTFPHLFIIVDEFAEMIAANPEYKDQFESVTRLGRAFGVTLILATQRPSGVVTDQMRANMKFRICLRVETPEDSKELLDRPDAAFLPNMGGRGYIQVGNDVLVPMQVARIAGDYSDDRTVVLSDVIWLDEEQAPGERPGQDAPLYSEMEIAEALGLDPGESPNTMLDWVVGVSRIEAQRNAVPVQRKPWPDPLPEQLSLTDPVDARYLNTERAISDDNKIIIHPKLKDWLENEEEEAIWPDLSWKNPPPMVATIGLIDNPYRAEQRLMKLDLRDGPVVLFSASGRGKTTFLKSVLLSLATERTPDALHMFALDFGRGGLKPIRDLPHLGAIIDVSESSRVDQLMRMLRSIVNERQEVLDRYNSLAQYNQKNPDSAFAEVVVAIDNFAEFSESYEYLVPELMTLIRDGRSFGIHFVVTAGSTRELTGKLYNLFTQRMTLTMSDATSYADIVGRGARRFDNVPGRGLQPLLVDEDQVPVEFHVGVPGRPSALSPEDDTVEGFQFIAQRMDRIWTALGGDRPAAELPRAVGYLDMYSLLENEEMTRIGDIPIADKWKHSMKPENQEWLRAPLGLISSREVREIVFSAKADGDGVHGMVAGTTGSGKSELLLTLIASMAMEYDPRIVNFVLVDFKGGAAFEPFKKLPHVVDIATNLQGNAVERIFIAMKAELDRRAKLLADGRVGDLVEYRKKVIPELDEDSELPHTFPHLFIIVDEFAEMIMENPDYKDQFESITRLGRAFGATLILATQRPSGMVTDQMRANMKFRICLRVETPDDSKELLGRDDAARLPPLGGRGYLQVGYGGLTEMQMAWAGSDYIDDPPDPEYPTEEILAALDREDGNKPGLMIDWIVGVLAAEAERQEIPDQDKPWPDPLPELLPLNERIDATYISRDRNKRAQTILITPQVADWVNNEDEEMLWEPYDWKAPLSLNAELGLIDNPFRAEQLLLQMNPAADPIAIFGAAGRGKTTLLKSLILSLGAEISPKDLNIFALDFGRGGLKGIADMPHVGATIDASQPERVDQLFRLIQSQMKARQEMLQAYSSLADYNAHKIDDPDNMFPAILVVIDNFAEFQESYDYLVPDLNSMVRDGRSLGIYYAVTASQSRDIPGKLFNSFPQRYAFTMADANDLVDLVGRGALALGNVPGRGLVNHEGRPLEFHVGMPVIPGDDDPYRTLSKRMEKVWFDAGGKRPAAELPRSATVLDMYSTLLGRPVERIGDIPIAENWDESLKPENQEWLTSPFALISSREVRELVFSAKANGDGVHGVIAGTTGSGKSELLLTMIAAMAARYDPRIVNFVLVDFKGGAAFEPFKKLPHVVDIATNLQGNAVERIFIAMKAELDRRAKLLADGRVGDLVEYRKKVIPDLKKNSKLPHTFPHLFIIVDEFAEMIMVNPEYKAQFESITRLGRAFGATLILATQRPAGMVTDQMRANMKFRICLRVETADDSKELLGRPDAANLPPLGGRGYLQVGGGPLTELQAAWAGHEYTLDENDPVYDKEEVLEALGRNEDNQPGIFIDWFVGAMAAEAKKREVPEQKQPWPPPLPLNLPLDEPIDGSYIVGQRQGSTITINEAVASWMKNKKAKPIWELYEWGELPPVKARIGLVDNPFDAEQRLMTLDLSSDPVAVLGASGRGKSTFLKSLMISLAADFSPEQLHMYVLDFGRGGLKSLRDLPHIGGIVEAHENERVERLMRIVRHTIDERQHALATYDSLEHFNKEHPDKAFPSVLVVIDNVTDFKETYDEHLMDLVNLVRDGRTFGVHFIVTGSIYSDIPSRLFNVLNQRITFAQIDPADYSMIVGKGWTTINNVPGRGLTVEQIENTPQPLEFHTAVPAGEPDGGHFRELAKRMNEAWQELVEKDEGLRQRAASSVEVLADEIALSKVLPELGAGEAPVSAPVGINDLDREPTLFELEDKGPHLIVIGPPMTGKTTTLRTLALSLAHSYSPSELGMIMVDASDPARRFYHYGAGEGVSLADLPHVLATVGTSEELDEVVMRLHAEYDDEVRQSLKGKSNGFNPGNGEKRRIVILIDHYDDVAMLDHGSLGLSALAEVGKGKDLHLVIGGSLDITRDSMDQLRRRAEASRYTLVLQDYDTVRYMGVRGDLTGDAEMPPGRGFLVKAIKASMTQICLPVAEGVAGISEDEALEEMISAIQKKYRKAAEWSFHGSDLAPLEEVLDLEGLDSIGSDGGDMDMGESMDELEALLAEQEAEMEAQDIDVTESEVDSMKKAELEELAEELGVTPSEGSGSGGSVLVDDLKDAIKAAL